MATPTHHAASLILCWLITAGAYAAIPSLRYEVIARYPHSDGAFTQGLELDSNTLYESSGLYGRSYIAKWSLQAPLKPERKHLLPHSIFGEGLTLLGDRIYVVTWREQRGLIFDKNTLTELGEFTYDGEGWGLTHNERALIMSDGTDRLRIIDPHSLQIEKTLKVDAEGVPVVNINELEWIPARDAQPARLLANIWQSDEIVVIDPDNGRGTARIDLSKLYPKSTRSVKADVLNGIALDASNQTLLVTGKFWPYIYRIRLLEALP